MVVKCLEIWTQITASWSCKCTFIKHNSFYLRLSHEFLTPNFCVAKRKKENKGKKERVSKQRLLKGYHQSQNLTALAIQERLELFYGPSALKSISPTLLCNEKFCFHLTSGLGNISMNLSFLIRANLIRTTRVKLVKKKIQNILKLGR